MNTTTKNTPAKDWGSVVSQFPVGRIVDAVIEKHASYGSLLRLEGEASGFIDPIERANRLGGEGDRIRVRVVNHRNENRQIGVVPVSPTANFMGQLRRSWMSFQPRLEQQLSELKSWFDGLTPDDQKRVEEHLEQIVYHATALRDVAHWSVPEIALREDFQDDDGNLVYSVDAAVTPVVLLNAVRSWNKGQPYIPDSFVDVFLSSKTSAE